MAGRRSSTEVVKNSRIRVWTMQGGASPFNIPQYQGFMKAGTPRATAGTGTPVTNQSADSLDEFDVIDEIPAARTLPTLGLTGRYLYEKSVLLEMHNQGCFLDAQAHIGKCQDPTDFTRGWDKILAVEKAKVTDWTTSGDMGALNESDRAVLDETATLTGQRLYEINKINLAEVAASDITDPVTGIIIADRIRCTGQCGGTASDGCQRVFAITDAGDLVWSEDGGATWDTSATGSVTPNGLIASGRNIIVFSEADESYFYAPIEDIIAGTEVWTEVTAGFTSGEGPRGAISLGASLNWFVGAGGQIYFSEDPESEVVVQSEAGSATAEDLNAIDAWDPTTLVIAGANNVVLYTDNGGETWTLVTGPSVGNDLLSVVSQGPGEWLVSDDNGGIFATKNYGRSWKTISKPTGVVADMKFSSSMVGWAALTTGGAGKLLRTIDGGRSWYVTPERTGGTTPTNTGLTRVAVCGNADHAFSAGTKGVGDGIVIEAA